MIGRKKLITIREELQRALTTTGDDPIRWLEERMAAPAGQGADAVDENEVLQSLRRFIEGSIESKRRKQRVKTKK
jgi:hypothetical protein